jgi:hypothetical protein
MIILFLIFGLLSKEELEAAGVKTDKLTKKEKWESFFKKA